MLSRRAVLTCSSAVVLGVAGCVGSDEVPDLVVSNDLDRSVSYSIEIARGFGGSTVFSEDGSLDAGASATFSDAVAEPGDYELRVVAGDREESYELTYSDDVSRGFEVRIEPEGLSVSETGG